MIAMSRLRWPRGLAGAHIEAVGRMPLWLAGQDFDHGLGHGVGAYLSVHEGPQRLSRVSQVPLEPGMILSNEPGYYREGAFGIRIENLLVVQEAPHLPGGDAHRDMLDWRTLAFVPIDRRLIVPDLLDPPARDWLECLSPRRGGKNRATGIASGETMVRCGNSAPVRRAETRGRQAMADHIKIRKASGTWTRARGRCRAGRKQRCAGTDRGRLPPGNLFPARGHRHGVPRSQRQDLPLPAQG